MSLLRLGYDEMADAFEDMRDVEDCCDASGHVCGLLAKLLEREPKAEDARPRSELAYNCLPAGATIQWVAVHNPK